MKRSPLRRTGGLSRGKRIRPWSAKPKAWKSRPMLTEFRETYPVDWKGLLQMRPRTVNRCEAEPISFVE